MKLFVVSFLLSTGFALAGNCPDFSGTYRSPNPSPAKESKWTWSQAGCTKVTQTWTLTSVDGAVSGPHQLEFVADGVFRKTVRDWTPYRNKELVTELVAYSFTTDAFVTEFITVQTDKATGQIETVQDKIVMKKSRSGKVFYYSESYTDENGNPLVASRKYNAFAPMSSVIGFPPAGF